MTSLALDKVITNYLPLLDLKEKQSLPAQIKSFLEKKNNSSTMTVEEFTVQYNKDIDDAKARIDSGIYITLEDLEKESETW